MVELKPNENNSPEFNVAKMNADVVSLRDLYGSEGFIFANIVAEPRFLEEPGLLDIVYKIEEGKQYYAGEIRIHYVGGGGGITRREVPLNRLSVRTGDLINVREIRNSERRLGAANIFANGQQGGASPRIVLSPAETKELERMASRAGYSAGTGGGSRH
jgi:outer membrane protein insertion porin family